VKPGAIFRVRISSCVQKRANSLDLILGRCVVKRLSPHAIGRQAIHLVMVNRA
jgi:hypothetical protein